MNDTFGTLTQPFIINTMKKNNTCVLELVMFCDMRHKNSTRAFRVLSCVIYTIIENYLWIDYLSFQSKQLREILIDRKYL